MEENLIDFTPELRKEALEILNRYDHGLLYTPPSERGAINQPGWGGGANWWGAAFDPETGILYIPSTSLYPIVVKLTKPDPARSDFNYVRGRDEAGFRLNGPRGLPLFKPPYGRITAINLNTGDHAWVIPHGDGLRQKVNAMIGNGKDVGPLGSGGGGPLLTKTLLFVGQGAGRGSNPTDAASMLRAFDKATGKVVAEIQLPATPHGTPMTYLAGGKQYVVIFTGDGRLVALALPSNLNAD